MPPKQKKNIVKSGNAGSKKEPEPRDPSVPPPLFPPGYKSPISLLQERCQKSGWNSAIIDAKPYKKQFTAAVILRRQNPKTKQNESVYMKPPEPPNPCSVVKDSALEARHWAAVYAMFRFSNHLQLKFQLPPSVRDYWILLESEKTSAPPHLQWLFSQNPFDAQPPPQPEKKTSSSSGNGTSSTRNEESSTIEASHDTPSHEKESQGPWAKAPHVRMPAALRSELEDIIRANLDATGIHAHSMPVSDPQLMAYFSSLGFREGHIQQAISFFYSVVNNSSLSPLLEEIARLSPHEIVLEHLLLHVPEEDLPAHIAKARPAENSVTVHDSRISLVDSWQAREFETIAGFPTDLSQQAVVWAKGNFPLAADLLVRYLNVDNSLFGFVPDFTHAQLPQVDGDLSQRRSDEITILQSVFPELHPADTLDICITPNDVTLKIFFHDKNIFPPPPDIDQLEPWHFPSFLLVSSKTPKYIILHVTSLIISQFQRGGTLYDLLLASVGGVLLEMTEFAKSCLETALRSPPDARKISLLLKKRQELPTETPALVAQEPQYKPTNSHSHGPKPSVTFFKPASENVLLAYSSRQESPGAAHFATSRSKLPAFAMKDSLVNAIKENQVVVISGETGSGKTTQVPAFIMEDLLAQGTQPRIVVTQPRRVSAIGVASRVAQEHMEDITNIDPTSLVGYAIRGERKASPANALLFCTTGVLLRKLNADSDPNLATVTHVFVDEVHERSADSDFLLLELKSILKRNPKLKVILMSATVDQEKFSSYFGSCPCLSIPGITYPVTDLYLEDFVAPLYEAQVKNIEMPPVASRLSQDTVDSMNASFQEHGVESQKLWSILERVSRQSKVSSSLVAASVSYIASAYPPGDILVFMPGAPEINRTVDLVKNMSSSNVDVYPLHANLTTQEQRKVFQPTPPGRIKVVIATNVAETSITIDGIIYVVDSGRVKENVLDVSTSVMRLEEQWAARSACKQRRGRAGRTRPGTCFKIFTRYVEQSYMVPFPAPEITRIPLEILCLHVKSIRDSEDVSSYLSRALDPPHFQAIENAWTTLVNLGAVHKPESNHADMSAPLTALGRFLSLIPTDLRIGKMLIYGVLFQCLDPLLALAALLSCKPLFAAPEEKRSEAQAARRKFYVHSSDLLSDVNAYLQVKATKTSRKAFCQENFISYTTFLDALSFEETYLNSLKQAGLVSSSNRRSPASLNRFSENSNLVKSIIYSGTGHLVRVALPVTKYESHIAGSIAKSIESKDIKFFEPQRRLFLHPGSLLFTETVYNTPFLTYFVSSETSKAFIRDATQIPLYAVLLYGPELTLDLAHGFQIGPVKMKAWPRIGVLVNYLRRLLDMKLLSLLEKSAHDFEQPPSQLITSVVKFLDL